jgi:transposase InsO family protein
MQLVTTDIMGPLKKTAKGFLYIMVVCDHYTKWVEAFPIRNLTANEAAQRLVQFIFRYGVPEIILSDQGTNFQSQVLVELWDLLDVRRVRTSPLHPQTDGLSERFNQTLRKMLAAYVSEKQNDWDQYLAPLCFAYNTAVHTTTRCTPFE